MSPELKQLRLWLMGSPRPATVRVVSTNNQEHKLEPKGRRWIEVAKSIMALDPAVIDALDAKGHSLRATRVAEIGAEEIDEPELEKPAPKATRGTLEVDVLIVIARLLAEAYKHSTDVAFERLGTLFETTQKRNQSLENTVSNLLKRANRNTTAIEEDEPTDFGQELLQQMFAGKVQGELEKAAKAALQVKPNGGADPKEQ